MDEQELSIQAHFADVTDPRKAWNQGHRLSDILVMALCGIICGADSWVSVAAFAEAKLPWFRRFLELPNGAPSHDTFSRVFAALDPKQLQQAFLSWVQAVHMATNGEVVAIDGKVMRGSLLVLSSSAATSASLCHPYRSHTRRNVTASSSMSLPHVLVTPAIIS